VILKPQKEAAKAPFGLQRHKKIILKSCVFLKICNHSQIQISNVSGACDVAVMLPTQLGWHTLQNRHSKFHKN